MNKRQSKKEAAYINFEFAAWILEDDEDYVEETAKQIIVMMQRQYGSIKEIK